MCYTSDHLHRLNRAEASNVLATDMLPDESVEVGEHTHPSLAPGMPEDRPE